MSSDARRTKAETHQDVGEARGTLTATNSAQYPAPVGITADPVLLTVRAREVLVLIAPRPEGGVGLPGGFVAKDETAEDTVARKLLEKTGLAGIYFEQLAAFTDPSRDYRGWIPTIAYVALVPPATEALDPDARWVSARKPPPLAFDHPTIISVAIGRVQGKLWWSNIAAGILFEPFAIAEAREVYEAIAGTTYDPSTFSRDLRATGLIQPTGELRPTRGRQARLYKFTTSDRLEWGRGRQKRLA